MPVERFTLSAVNAEFTHSHHSLKQVFKWDLSRVSLLSALLSSFMESFCLKKEQRKTTTLSMVFFYFPVNQQYNDASTKMITVQKHWTVSSVTPGNSLCLKSRADIQVQSASCRSLTCTLHFCLFFFSRAPLFPTSLCTAEERHDEGKHLQIGQQRAQSAVSPSAPLMTTWLFCDGTRLAGEAS